MYNTHTSKTNKATLLGTASSSPETDGNARGEPRAQQQGVYDFMTPLNSLLNSVESAAQDVEAKLTPITRPASPQPSPGQEKRIATKEPECDLEVRLDQMINQAARIVIALNDLHYRIQL